MRAAITSDKMLLSMSFIHMHKKRRTVYISYFLFAISIIMLISSSLPHHHHNSGAVCLKEDISTHTMHNDLKHSQNHCCGDECTSRFQFRTNNNTQVNHAQPHYLFAITLFTKPLLRWLLQTQSKSIAAPPYLEKLHNTSIAYAVGRRGPPTLL